MKKIISIILAIAMAAAVSMPIFALSDTVPHYQEGSIDGTNAMGAHAEVEYGVSEMFEIVIPDINFNLGEVQNDNKIHYGSYIEVINPTIKTDRHLVITVAAASAQNASDDWKLKVASNPATRPVVYEVRVVNPTGYEKSGVLKNGDPVLIMHSVDGRLEDTFGAYRYRHILDSNTVGSHQSGAYEDQLTFTIEITGDLSKFQ